MSKKLIREKPEMGTKELRALRGELWIVLPFFILSVIFFGGSFQYKVEASSVPMFIGLVTTILTGMRLIYILFPGTRIGRFKEAGLGGEFDHMKGEIEEKTLKGYHEEETRGVAFSQEKKAFIALIGCFLGFLLFGYFAGTIVVIIGSSYYYGYRKKGPILISLVTMFFIVYVILYRLLEAPAYHGLLMEPILDKLGLI
jgi:hypothetical protein